MQVENEAQVVRYDAHILVDEKGAVFNSSMRRESWKL